MAVSSPGKLRSSAPSRREARRPGRVSARRPPTPRARGSSRAACPSPGGGDATAPAPAFMVVTTRSGNSRNISFSSKRKTCWRNGSRNGRRSVRFVVIVSRSMTRRRLTWPIGGAFFGPSLRESSQAFTPSSPHRSPRWPSCAPCDAGDGVDLFGEPLGEGRLRGIAGVRRPVGQPEVPASAGHAARRGRSRPPRRPARRPGPGPGEARGRRGSAARPVPRSGARW